MSSLIYIMCRHAHTHDSEEVHKVARYQQGGPCGVFAALPCLLKCLCARRCYEVSEYELIDTEREPASGADAGLLGTHLVPLTKVMHVEIGVQVVCVGKGRCKYCLFLKTAHNIKPTRKTFAHMVTFAVTMDSGVRMHVRPPVSDRVRLPTVTDKWSFLYHKRLIARSTANKALRFLEAQVGKPYDFFALFVLSSSIGRRCFSASTLTSSRSSWTCVSLAIATLLHCNLSTHLLASCDSHDLNKLVTMAPQELVTLLHTDHWTLATAAPQTEEDQV